MPRIIHKYGGTSVGDIGRIKNVAQRIKAAREEGHEVIVSFPPGPESPTS